MKKTHDSILHSNFESWFSFEVSALKIRPTYPRGVGEGYCFLPKYIMGYALLSPLLALVAKR